MSTAAAPLELARAVLAGRPAWLVGGAVRDRQLGRATDDLDVVLVADVAAVARELARAGRAASFELSGEFGAWRVVARDRRWQIDLNPLRGSSLQDDLAIRDFTVNAMAEPLDGGELVDPFGGLADLRARRLRMVSANAFAADPLRVLRLARLACDLDLAADAESVAAARAAAGGLEAVAAERVFGEFKRLLVADAVVDGLRLMDELGATRTVLPELSALHGVEQNRFHHLDVYGHTIEVLEGVLALQRDPAAYVGAEHAEAVAALLAEPLADELDRAAGLRLGALLHDAAKPLTRGQLDDGRVIFPGHDVEGARLTRAVLARLRASERLRAHVAELARHHLRLGFLVHERPLSRRAVYRYLRACDPVEVDVTLLSIADRVATRGDRADESIARHLELARELLREALRWRAAGPPTPLLRGDELAGQLSIEPGPELGRLLEELAEAQFAGEIADRGQALALAARLNASR